MNKSGILHKISIDREMINGVYKTKITKNKTEYTHITATGNLANKNTRLLKVNKDCLDKVIAIKHYRTASNSTRDFYSMGEFELIIYTISRVEEAQELLFKEYNDLLDILNIDRSREYLDIDMCFSRDDKASWEEIPRWERDIELCKKGLI